MLSYCLSCRKNTESKNRRAARIKRGKSMSLSKCGVRGSKRPRFMKEQEASLLFLGTNSPLNKILLLGAIF